MKGLKRVTSIVLTVAMVAGLVAFSPAKTDAAVKLTYGKKLTIVMGDSDSIVVKGKANQKKAKYTSSNKKVATVSKKGVVKGKKAGTCTITIKVGKSKAKSKVTVIPKNVTIGSAALASSTSAKVTWTALGGVSGYYVYYSTDKAGTYAKVAVAGAGSNSATISNLTLGATYYFKVRAYAKAGSKVLLSAEDSKIVSIKTWKMVWNDEFDGTKLDTSKWNNNGATGAGGYGNNELQNYQMDYCEVTGGSLVIKPQFQWNTATKKCVSGQYYSTKLWTRNIYSVQYGKIEFRAKMPKGQGTWAAAWMLGNNNGWPLCGEIDVLETTKESSKTIIPQSIHCNRFNGMPTSSGNKYKNTTVSDATTAYHTYGIIWTAKTITFTIDGKTTWTYDPSRYVVEGDGTNNIDIWPYNQPFYLILNCAIGGTLGGDVNPNYWTKIATNGNIETYQDKYYIDWVRVYQ